MISYFNDILLIIDIFLKKDDLKASSINSELQQALNKKSNKKPPN